MKWQLKPTTPGCSIIPRRLLDHPRDGNTFWRRIGNTYLLTWLWISYPKSRILVVKSCFEKILRCSLKEASRPSRSLLYRRDEISRGWKYQWKSSYNLKRADHVPQYSRDLGFESAAKVHAQSVSEMEEIALTSFRIVAEILIIENSQKMNIHEKVGFEWEEQCMHQELERTLTPRIVK